MHITVIGAASIDIFVKSKGKINQGKSNPSGVSLRAGGEARNIASLLVRNNAEVSLITAVGADALGALLRDSCADIGINTDSWIIKNNVCTCVNLSALENDGTMFAGFNATSAPESIRVSELNKYKNLITEADLLILELNLTEKILAAALELRGKAPVLVSAVSESKVKRIENMLNKIDVLKLNRSEAESLTGIKLDTKDRVKQACYNLVIRGASRVFITLGPAGACAAENNNAIFVPSQAVEIRDVTGAGEAFTAGLALNMDKDLLTQAQQGVAFAENHLMR